METSKNLDNAAEAITLKAGATAKNGSVELRATGLYACTAAAGLALAYTLTQLDPFGKPAHFVLALILSFVLGTLVDASVHAARMADALREKENYRQEVNRMAADKSRLEEALLTQRLSSVGAPTAPSPPRGRKRS